MLKTKIQICIADSIFYLFAIKEKIPKDRYSNKYLFSSLKEWKLHIPKFRGFSNIYLQVFLSNTP
jgi:hypothetical protein